jgi:hypothetical protein
MFWHRQSLPAGNSCEESEKGCCHSASATGPHHDNRGSKQEERDADPDGVLFFRLHSELNRLAIPPPSIATRVPDSLVARVPVR